MERTPPPFEQQTIITFNEEEDEASIYTCNQKWIEQLEKSGFKAQSRFKSGRLIFKEFEVPKLLIEFKRISCNVT